jgi:hypothetical protein
VTEEEFLKERGARYLAVKEAREAREAFVDNWVFQKVLNSRGGQWRVYSAKALEWDNAPFTREEFTQAAMRLCKRKTLRPVLGNDGEIAALQLVWDIEEKRA